MAWVTVWAQCEGEVECHREETSANRFLRGFVEVEWVALDAILTRQTPARASAMERPSSQKFDRLEGLDLCLPPDASEEECSRASDN